MRRLLRVFTVIAVVSCAPLSNACGDKLLVLGRALRFSNISSERPAAILAYAPQGSIVSVVLNEPQWVAAIEKGKHRLRVVQELDGIVTAMSSQRYDLVVVSLADAAQLKQRIQSASSAAVIVPALQSSPSREEVRAAEKEYGVVLKSESKGKAYLSYISKAVELRDRRAQVLAQAHKSGRIS
jgi:hypothetical protein